MTVRRSKYAQLTLNLELQTTTLRIFIIKVVRYQMSTRTSLPALLRELTAWAVCSANFASTSAASDVSTGGTTVVVAVVWTSVPVDN